MKLRKGRCERSQRHHAVMPQDASCTLPLSKRTRHVVQNGLREALRLLEAFPQCGKSARCEDEIAKRALRTFAAPPCGNASGCQLHATRASVPGAKLRSAKNRRMSSQRFELEKKCIRVFTVVAVSVYKVVVDGFKVDDTPPTTPPLLEFRITCPETFLVGPLLETLIFVLPASKFSIQTWLSCIIMTCESEFLQDWNEGEQVQPPKPPPGDPVSINQLILSVVKILAELVSIMENRLLLKPVVVQQTLVGARQALR
jgi:hypothetical protein